MLSQYTWGQFFLFVVVVLVLYYLVVGLMYYRDDFSALLKGKKGAGPQLAGAGADSSAAGPPSLVRARSAFVASPTATEPAPESAAAKDAPEDGAADNLPEAAAVVVGGTLLSSTSRATGRNDSTDDEGPMDAASSVTGATDEESAMDADREEEDDRPNEALAAIIRQKAHEQQPDGSDATENKIAPTAASKINTDGALIESKRTLVDGINVEPEIVYQTAVESGCEPLADFNEPVASLSDVAPALEEDLPVDSIASYIAKLQEGEKPVAPAALAGTNLLEQLAQFSSDNLALLTSEVEDEPTSESTNELDNLFGDEPE